MKLDTYMVPGVYKCSTNDAAKTLLNCPTKNAFTLFVYKSLGEADPYITQEFRDYSGLAVIKRTLTTYNGIWGESYEYGSKWKLKSIVAGESFSGRVLNTGFLPFGHYAIFGFYNVTDNPFQTLNSGYCIAIRETDISQNVWCLGFNASSGKIETALVTAN